MRRGRDPSRTPSRPRRPVWDNPRGQLPGTGIRSDGENLYGGNLYGGSTQGVSGNSSGGVAVTGEPSSGGRSLPVNVLGNGSGGTGIMPKLVDLHKEAVKKFGEEPLTGAAEQRYRRVLGQLAWAALSRADLSFPISFLSRFQAKPNPAAEHCMRTFLKWLAMHLHFVQRMPATQCPYVGEPKEVISFCDASWGLDSVSGAIIIYKGCCIKFFSRKQEVPALSSAEAEIISIVETAKEMVSIGMLLQTVIQGIPLDPLGMPQQNIGEMGLRMFNDAKAAISMGKMDGLLRRVRHLELRVKYCQHLHKTRKLSITHWKGEENPSDGLTKSLRPLSLWTNLVEAVGLVPGPTDQGSNWIRNYLNLIQQENELDTFLALPFVASKKGISRKNC